MTGSLLLTGAAAERDVYTVSRLNREARMLLERGLPAMWLEGEVSNFSQPSSGHWYFSLKDAQAQVRCAMFRQRNVLARYKPANGAKVLVRARVSLYEPRGEYQLIVDYLEDAGEGELRRQFELLKAKLQREGLFSPERKRELPALPRRIGVITSPTGAAIRDILNVLKRRFAAVPVLIYPVPVQGAGAAAQIAAAIRLASGRADCDVLILARGGGSLEDLWAFNEEPVARALADCRIPLVSGIGHEVDFTIADFVADVRAPTPSAAAELVVPDGELVLEQLIGGLRRLVGSMRRLLKERLAAQGWLAGRLTQLHPGVRLRHQAQRVDDLEQRLRFAVRRRLDVASSRIERLEARLRVRSPERRLVELGHRVVRLQARLEGTMQDKMRGASGRLEIAVRALNGVSPLATLDRGYAIVTRRSDGMVVRSAAEVTVGDRIEARLHVGRVQAVIEGKNE